MRDEFDEPQPATSETTPAGELLAPEAPALLLPQVPAGIQLLNRDFLTDVANIPDASIDLILCDPPYGLGKDYGNDSDMRTGDDFLAWTRGWLELAIPKLKPSGSLYIFCTWQYAPEIFSFLKT
ncbi:DNA methyltransferase, partial [Paraburkholderia graminis]